MSSTRLASAAFAAFALVVAPALLSASDQPTPSKETNQTRATPAETISTSQFAALKGVKAVAMSSAELSAVKGLHFHFTTPSGKELFVNVQQGKDEFTPTPNADPAPDGFPLGVGKGYRGLCGAALNSPGLSIPGQNEVTGVGGGC